MADREEVRKELIEIAEVLARFPAAVQPRVFDILAAKLLVKSDATRKATDRAIPRGAAEKLSANVRADSKTRQRATEGSLGILKDLNLRGTDDLPSFAQFVEQKRPTSNIAFNAVAAYYLREVRSMTGITPDHIYTCYKEVKRRPPSTAPAFRQSLWDTSSSRYGYLDTSSMDDIKVPQRGINFVEHDLPAPTQQRTKGNKG